MSESVDIGQGNIEVRDIDVSSELSDARAVGLYAFRNEFPDDTLPEITEKQWLEVGKIAAPKLGIVFAKKRRKK